VIELVKAGPDTERCRAYLEANAPSYLPRFEEAVARARAEEEA